MGLKPICFKSNPSYQSQAENDCKNCNVERECLIMKSESEVQQLILLEAPKYGCVLMRNNSGSFVDKDGRHVRFGLNNLSQSQNEKIKSSDLIGLMNTVKVKTYTTNVGPESLEVRCGCFIAVECKKEGWKFNPKDKREVAQKAFIDWIIMNGGVAGFCASVEDFLRLIGR